MLNWAMSPQVKKMNMAFVLVDEKLSDVSDRLTGFLIYLNSLTGHDGATVFYQDAVRTGDDTGTKVVFAPAFIIQSFDFITRLLLRPQLRLSAKAEKKRKNYEKASHSAW